MLNPQRLDYGRLVLKLGIETIHETSYSHSNCNIRFVCDLAGGAPDDCPSPSSPTDSNCGQCPCGQHLCGATCSDHRLPQQDGEARAAMVVAVYSGAMAMAKVEQRGEPLRLCADQLKRLL